MNAIDRRLRQLEIVGDCDGIADLIGRYFDEMTEQEQERWSENRYGLDAATVAEIELAVMGSTHFLCDRRPKPLTKAECARNTAEVEAAVNEYIRQYNGERE